MRNGLPLSVGVSVAVVSEIAVRAGLRGAFPDWHLRTLGHTR